MKSRLFVHLKKKNKKKNHKKKQKQQTIQAI